MAVGAQSAPSMPILLKSPLATSFRLEHQGRAHQRRITVSRDFFTSPRRGANRPRAIRPLTG